MEKVYKVFVQLSSFKVYAFEVGIGGASPHQSVEFSEATITDESPADRVPPVSGPSQGFKVFQHYGLGDARFIFSSFSENHFEFKKVRAFK